jgi:cation:H+ antiporter
VLALTAGGLLLTAAFVSDGSLGRIEGLVLVLAWVGSVVVVSRVGDAPADDESPRVRIGGHAWQALVVLAMLLLVGVGATAAVRALVALSEDLGVPTFALAFFGASVGTSAPEIVVDLTALARGAPAIALGDALGSSLVDSTLSIGIGPLVQPAPVSTRVAVAATFYTGFAVALVAALLLVRRRLDRRSMPVLLGLYALSYVVVIAAR